LSYKTPEKKHKKSVSVKTFKNYSTGGMIGFEEDDGLVVKMWCKLCARHSNKIWGHPPVKGVIAKDACAMIEGTMLQSGQLITTCKIPR